MEDPTPEQQSNARFSLVLSAKRAKMDGFSAFEWMTNEEVLDYCKDYQLSEDLLEHIVHWVWLGVNR